MEKLNSEELTKKVQEVKESKTHRLGGGKFRERIYELGAAVIGSRFVKNVSAAAVTAAAFTIPAVVLAGINWAGTTFVRDAPSLGGKIATGAIVGAFALAADAVAIAGAAEPAKGTFEFIKSLCEEAADSLQDKAKALAEKRKASEVKEEVSANAPAEKASETPSKPKASKSQADKAMQTLMKNKQLARV